MMDSTKHRFFAPCPRGLEGILEEELHDLGVPMTHRTAGGVAFQAPWATMYWVNLKSHIASRVLWEVGQSAYRTEEDVYRAAYALLGRTGSCPPDHQGEGERASMSLFPVWIL